MRFYEEFNESKNDIKMKYVEMVLFYKKVQIFICTKSIYFIYFLNLSENDCLGFHQESSLLTAPDCLKYQHDYFSTDWLISRYEFNFLGRL